VFGDSTALLSGLGLAWWGVDSGDALPVDGSAVLGCGLLPVPARMLAGQLDLNVANCADPAVEWPLIAAASAADIAVVQVGTWEVTDQQLVPDGPFLAPTDAELRAALSTQLAMVADGLLEHVALVVLLLTPDVGEAGLERGGVRHPEVDPSRMAEIRSLQREVAETDVRVVTIDLQKWLETKDDNRMRPDGVHFTWATASEVGHDYLGPEIIRHWEVIEPDTQ
jgi:hypothetical protein